MEEPTKFTRQALPHDLKPYTDAAVELSMEDFELKYAYPFLLYARSKLWDPSLIAVTQREAGNYRGEQTQLVSYEITQGGHTFISAIRKVQSGPNEPGIVLGRGTRTDVVVPIGSVSTNHLRFLPPQPGKLGVWSVLDLASRNGTWLNEERLEGESPSPITDGHYLRLGGNLISWFLYPGRLWHVLRTPGELQKLTDL